MNKMRVVVTVIRIVTGLLFIFSGLIKAIDPLGLAYKMQEFFEVWGQTPALSSFMSVMEYYAVIFSIIMIMLEVAVGVALLTGWQKKLTVRVLLVLMIFFTFLTSFVLFTGKIRACGCFGDCVPLTPLQTFTKDILLLVFVLFLMFNSAYIRPVAKPLINTLYVALAAMLTLFLQWHVMRHLPLMDCLPFKKGNNILQLRKMPANAVQDKFEYVFIYEKNGLKKEFVMPDFPDSTWAFVDRTQKLVQKGENNVPLINDFSLTSEEGADVTESILNEPGEYYLLFIKEYPGHVEKVAKELKAISDKAISHNRKLYVITGQRGPVELFLAKKQVRVEGVLTCDVIAIKTAARANPAILLMKGPIVMGKWSWADFEDVP